MSKEKKNDLTIKIFALIIAIILWSYVMSEENPTITKEFRNTEVSLSNYSSLERQGLVIMEPKDPKITIKISGKRNYVNRILEEDILASVDLSGYSEGSVKVPVYIDVPSEVRIVDYHPKEILFKFEKLVRKEAVVTVDTDGSLPQGYVLGEPEIKPQSVYIEGPRSWVDSVTDVVATVDLTNRTEDIKVTVPIKLIDEKGDDVRGVEKEQNLVDVFIPVYKVKKVPIELQTENQLPDNYEVMDISINPSEIEIKGKKEDLKNINSIKTMPIDINYLIGKRNVVVELDLPENISLVDPKKQVTITLNIEESRTKTFNYTLEDVDIINLSSGLIIDEGDLSKSFEVTIRGSSTKVDLLNKEDLSIELDLQGLEAGSHQAKLSVKDGEDFMVINIQPEDLNITLKEE
ncbi:CdaR family protein [Clostridium sp. Cult3]|uniref:CdaR family protein n=1 Tax=Clostridium sp. Cult3 TaxID=2079004 RepID=UPI001EEF572B|nr:CdaR family protein [Clostridium sp. Cult3]MCF6461526.1 hypothetical protein [Clostridium sp. Cult3]